MRIALLADIHGNLPAFEVVLGALERQQPDYVVVDGDLINGTPLSHDVVQRIRQQDWVVVRGNHEFYLLDFGTDRAAPGSEDPERWGQLHWLAEQITPDQYNYLAMLPDERTFYLNEAEPICVTHGVPGHNRLGFYPKQTDEEIVAQIKHVAQPTLVSAHTHQQIDRHVQGLLHNDETGEATERHWHVINPGSVGLPLNGNTKAQFAILENRPVAGRSDTWEATHFSVSYDRRPILEAFLTSGMLEAGGVLSQLFYWQICTAEAEIIYFFRWASQHGYDPNGPLHDAFAAYNLETGRDVYIASVDPLNNGTEIA